MGLRSKCSVGIYTGEGFMSISAFPSTDVGLSSSSPSKLKNLRHMCGKGVEIPIINPGNTRICCSVLHCFLLRKIHLISHREALEAEECAVEGCGHGTQDEHGLDDHRC